MNRVIVTGATGFLGFNLAKRLKQDGFEVIGLGRNQKKGEELSLLGIKFIKIDLTNKKELDNIFNNIVFVFHCAAKSSVWGNYNSFYDANVIVTKNILDISLKNKVKKVIYVSSPSVYFDYKDKFNIKEDEKIPIKSANNYIKTKKEAELLVEEFIKKGLKIITIRPRGIFGVGDNALLPRLIKANKKFIPKTVKNDILIDITYVDNVVESMILAMNAPEKCNGQIYNITNDENIYFYETLKTIIEKLGLKYHSKNISYKKMLFFASILEKIYSFIPNKESIFTKYSIGLLSFNQTLDISKAKNELNYKPIVAMKDGIEKTINYYKENNNVQC